MKPSPAEETFESRYGVPSSESAVPAVRDAAYATLRQAAPKSGGFMGWLKGATLVLGVMYAIGWASTTLIVAGASNLGWRTTSVTGTYERTVIAEAVRSYTLTRDPSITPERAGQAYLALQSYPSRSTDFRVRGIPNRPSAPWRRWGTMDPSLFASARPTGPILPNPATVITAAAAGLKPREIEMLRQIASAALWRGFELVGRAPGIDVVGAQFELPFGATENVFMMPTARFGDTRELANAGVSRAAWYVTQGRMDLAEQALRAVVSFGFAMIDNAVVPFEQLIGNAIVGTGRDGLIQLFAATKDPRGPSLERAVKEAPRNQPVPVSLANAAFLRDPGRQRLIAVADDPTVARAIRYQALANLAFHTCRNPVELVAGPSTETRDAFARARKNLARYPGEHAYLDLVEGILTRPFPVNDANAVDASIAGAAGGVSALFINPRLHACTLIARGQIY